MTKLLDDVHDEDIDFFIDKLHGGNLEEQIYNSLTNLKTVSLKMDIGLLSSIDAYAEMSGETRTKIITFFCDKFSHMIIQSLNIETKKRYLEIQDKKIHELLDSAKESK